LDLADVEGVARLDGGALVLEFRTVDAFVGLIKSELDEVRLGLQDLESVSHKRGWLHDTLLITTRSMSSLESIPGAKGAELKLRCKRKHRAAAESVSSTLRLQIADRHLEDLRRGPPSASS
jgi:hypothetical protein